MCRGGCQGRKSYAGGDFRDKIMDIIMNFMISRNDFSLFGAMFGKGLGDFLGATPRKFITPFCKECRLAGEDFRGDVRGMIAILTA